MNAADKRASAMLREYLSIGADEQCRADPMQVTYFQLGSALAMLRHLLGLTEGSYPDTAREMLEKWRAEQPAEAQSFAIGDAIDNMSGGDNADSVGEMYRDEQDGEPAANTGNKAS